MSEAYPLLTEENVWYWYWGCDPLRSGHDIAKEVGCYFQKVYVFMKNHDIPIRSYSEAGKAMFEDPKKHQAYLKARMSPEYLQKQSESHKALWKDSELRAQRSRLLKGLFEKVLTDVQKVILYSLKDKKRKFVRELVVETSLDNSTLYRNLVILRNRGLVSSVKKNDEKGQMKRKYNRFWILERGLEVLHYNQNNEPFEFDALVTKVKSAPKNLELVESNKRFLGKNQKILLKILSDGNYYFVKELYHLTHLKIIGKSLCALYNRGYVGRTRQIDPTATGNNKKAYKYYLNESGADLIKDI